VRNYQARNMMRDEMKVGDQVFFYHSNCKEPGIVGIAEVVREGYPDHTAFDPNAKYHDPKSDPDNPRWFMVDLKYVRHTKRTITLSELKDIAAGAPTAAGGLPAGAPGGAEVEQHDATAGGGVVEKVAEVRVGLHQPEVEQLAQHQPRQQRRGALALGAAERRTRRGDRWRRRRRSPWPGCGWCSGPDAPRARRSPDHRRSMPDSLQDAASAS
jgi:hypothetical protein